MSEPITRLMCRQGPAGFELVGEVVAMSTSRTEVDMGDSSMPGLAEPARLSLVKLNKKRHAALVADLEAEKAHLWQIRFPGRARRLTFRARALSIRSTGDARAAEVALAVVGPMTPSRLMMAKPARQKGRRP